MERLNEDVRLRPCALELLRLGEGVAAIACARLHRQRSHDLLGETRACSLN